MLGKSTHVDFSLLGGLERGEHFQQELVGIRRSMEHDPGTQLLKEGFVGFEVIKSCAGGSEVWKCHV